MYARSSKRMNSDPNTPFRQTTVLSHLPSGSLVDLPPAVALPRRGRSPRLQSPATRAMQSPVSLSGSLWLSLSQPPFPFFTSSQCGRLCLSLSASASLCQPLPLSLSLCPSLPASVSLSNFKYNCGSLCTSVSTTFEVIARSSSQAC